MKSADFWDKSAKKYSQSPIKDEITYRKKLNESQEHFKPDMHILEFGCGTGTTAIHHSPFVKHIDAIDTSQKMIDICQEKAEAASVENITFSKSSLFELDAYNDSYDAILALNVIHLITNRNSVLSEVSRILKPGGVFISSTACLGGSYLRFIAFFAPLVKFFGLMPTVFVMTESQLANDIQNAGFSIESQWHHGTDNIEVFIVARKNHTKLNISV